jgi:hypothetical protein
VNFGAAAWALVAANPVPAVNAAARPAASIHPRIVVSLAIGRLGPCLEAPAITPQVRITGAPVAMSINKFTKQTS